MADPVDDETVPEVEKCCVVLRAVFNYLRFDERVADGTLPQPTWRPRDVCKVAAGKKVLFDLIDRDGTTRLARTVDRMNPDGSIGDWGKRDPKWLRVGDEAWITPRDRHAHDCLTCRLYNERHGNFEAAPSPCAEQPRREAQI
jgi:hypothetical protein